MKTLSFLSTIFLLTACVGSANYELPNAQWPKEKAIAYTQALEADKDYALDFLIENTQDFPTRNLFLLLDILEGDRVVVKDTLRYFLADTKGNWYGDNFLGLSSSWKSLIRYQKLIKIKQAQNYTFSVRHGMRFDTLQGIQQIGFKLEEYTENQ